MFFGSQLQITAGDDSYPQILAKNREQECFLTGQKPKDVGVGQV